MSSDDRLEHVSTTIIATSDYTSVFGTAKPPTPPTAILSSSFPIDNAFGLVYVVSFTESNNVPFATSFTLTSTMSSTSSYASQAGASSIQHSSSSSMTNITLATPDTTHSGAVSATSTETSSSTVVGPATRSATAARTIHDGPTVSSGAAAGIALACAAVGAILAAAIVGFFARKRYHRTANKSRGFNQTSSLELSPKDRSRPIAGFSKPHNVQSRMEPLAALLPSPIQDRTILGDFSKLGTSIKNHAQSFYSASDVSTATDINMLTGSNITALFPTHSQLEFKEIVALLNDPRSRIIGVRIALISAIVKGLDPDCQVERTLLPPGFASCVASFRAFGGKNDRRTVLLSKWRHITGSLLEPTYGTNFEPEDARWPAINRMADDLDSLLQPFASSSPSGDRRRNMLEILKRGARFGYMLLTQPTEWTFDWTPCGDGASAAIVVHPGLMQIADDQGQNLNSPIRTGDQAQCVSIR